MNWCWRSMPRVSLPAAPASARKHGVSAVTRRGSSSSAMMASRTRLVSETSAVGMSQKSSSHATAVEIAGHRRPFSGVFLGGRSAPQGLTRDRNYCGTPELVLVEFRQLPRPKHHLVAHQQRRRHLRVAVLGRVQVEHELAERAFEARELAAQHHEARARELRGGFEIHQAHAPRRARNAPSARRSCAGCRSGSSRRCRARPRRPAPPGSAGSGSRRAPCRAPRSPRAPPPRARHALLQLRHLGHQRVRPRLVLLRLRLADLLRQRVAALLRLLRCRDGAPALLVERDELRRHRREPALREAVVEGLRVVADEADVVHGIRTRHRPGWPGHPA